MFNNQAYFVKYEVLGEISYCQIEALSTDQCKEIFYNNFDAYCLIKSIKPSREFAECFKSSMVEKIKYH